MRHTRILRQSNPPELRGHLVDANSPPVHIIKHVNYAQLTENEEIKSLSREEKLDNLTRDGKSPNERMARLPHHLAKRINKMTMDSEPQLVRQRVAKMFLELQNGGAFSPALEASDVDAHIQGFFLQNYVSCVNSLKEIKKRQPDFVPKSILDVGFGPATGLSAAREVFGHDMDETCVLLGHPRMRVRAKDLLKTEQGTESAESDVDNTKFRYDIPGPNSLKRYDLIISQHQLYQTGNFNEELADSHAQQLARLCYDDGIVIFIERGDPLGFEAVTVAREHLLRPKYKYGVVGPCSHSKKCPLQLGSANREALKNPGKENWCRFIQNVERPRFTKELKRGQYLAQKWVPDIARGAGGESLKGGGRPKGANNEYANFSWVALRNNMRKSTDTKAKLTQAEITPEMVNTSNEVSANQQWPRISKTPMKRQGHVTMQVCTSEGEIEQWTVPKSQGKQAYHDVRKAEAGDLWASDAKTKQRRGGLRETALADAAAEIEKQRKAAKMSRKPVKKDACIDWWSPRSNPHYKHGSHQARIHAENMADPEDDSFVGVMSALIEDETREQKVTNRELQKRYR